jgi:hypothetical protein
MRKLVLATALIALSGAAAFAGPSPYLSPADGPAAYPDAQARWDKLRSAPAASPVIGPGQPVLQPTLDTIQPNAAKPNG